MWPSWRLIGWRARCDKHNLTNISSIARAHTHAGWPASQLAWWRVDWPAAASQSSVRLALVNATSEARFAPLLARSRVFDSMTPMHSGGGDVEWARAAIVETLDARDAAQAPGSVRDNAIEWAAAQLAARIARHRWQAREFSALARRRRLVAFVCAAWNGGGGGGHQSPRPALAAILVAPNGE